MVDEPAACGRGRGIGTLPSCAMANRRGRRGGSGILPVMGSGGGRSADASVDVGAAAAPALAPEFVAGIVGGLGQAKPLSDAAGVAIRSALLVESGTALDDAMADEGAGVTGAGDAAGEVGAGEDEAGAACTTT